MRLEIGQNIDNTRVRLNFKKGNSKPEYMPSYEIQKSKADEFVAKYNEQSAKLKKTTLLSVVISTLFGGFVGFHMNNKFWFPAGIIVGMLSGIGIGAAVSSYNKNKLMDEYGVKHFDNKEKQ